MPFLFHIQAIRGLATYHHEGKEGAQVGLSLTYDGDRRPIIQ